MGGLSSLVYTFYSKRTPASCVAICPVCDAVYHFTERSDLPRTMYSALYNYPGTLEDALKSISPLHLAPNMPQIAYHLFHCGKDTAVNLHKHSEAFVSEMKKYGHNITLDLVPDRDHGNFTLDAKRRFAEYIVSAIETK